MSEQLIRAPRRYSDYEQKKDYTLLNQMLRDYSSQEVDDRLSPSESMSGLNYMYVGESAVEVIMKCVFSSHLTEVNRVLDMPCGHGRVLRHLTKLFPNAQIDACDLDSEGVNFCSDTFGANPIISQEDLTLVRFPDLYDLIWIGILFTHLPLNITEKWLNFLADQLTERGIIVATFHGRWAMALHERVPYISEDRWETIKSDYESLGYGFAPYKRDETHDFIESTYGISVSKPQLIVEIISRIPETRIYFYQEKAWGHNHDVVAFGRPGWTGHPNVKY